ncbi:4-hydroxy-tetrahydrodipicolinate synthase [Thermotoga sp. KOL6]|uniref:4-hydroxy-tetrahydrodipicolinate synthase n=1 Tax=Thermotoga sp. KOL6 TaxID=126741 RepID=UPI000C794CA5|nr:4-hydroxy-tetrahydrodipicolinate synthase [Thermotoga sp. KOL6]PLV59049.1 dihydrodipicolinate synthase family protein [Thermotoga sp. KOL6]
MKIHNFRYNVVEKFGRVLLPLITVFKEDQSIDYKTTRKVARYVIERGFCDSIIVSGTTGEFYAMSVDERIRLLREIKDEVGNEVPLIAGTGAIFVEDVIRLNQEAERLGYDAVMVVLPYYCHPEQEGIYQHFKIIAENTSLPIMVYNIPLFVGVNLEPKTLARIAEFDNVIAVKDEAGLHPVQTTDYIKATSGKLAVYSGDDTMILQVLVQGGVGVVSGGAHVVGDIIKAMIDDHLNGKNEEAMKKYHVLMDLFAAFHGVDGKRVNPTPLVKAAFEMISGLPTSAVRLPLIPATDEERAKLKDVLKRIGKID